VIGIAVGAAVVVAGTAVTGWLLARPPSAEDAARIYLSSLSDGDFARIDTMMANAGDEDSHRLIADAFVGAEAYIDDPSIEEVSSPQAGFTTVRASAELDGERRTLHFALSNASGEWMLAGAYLAVLEVSTDLADTGMPAGDSVWIGGALAPAGTRVGLLPAQYPVTAAPRGLLTGETSVAVSNDRTSTVQLEVSLSPAATSAAQDQLDLYMDACTMTATAVPANCGIRVPWAADLVTLGSIAFRMDQRPAVTLSPDGRTFAATGGVIVATATGIARDGGAGTFTYRADDWALRGTVSFQGDEMVLAVG
jgi:hypothetical protein